MLSVGDPEQFAIESSIQIAYESVGLMGLGYFVIWIDGNSYGVHESDATMLACSLTEVRKRLACRGTHTATFSVSDGSAIANAYSEAIFSDDPKPQYFGIPLERFQEIIYTSDIAWCPDGDEAFDDGSYILQFDVGEMVRLLAFKRTSDGDCDPTTFREVRIKADRFYNVLAAWARDFESTWVSMPKNAG